MLRRITVGVALAIFLGATAIHAATFTVTNANASGAGSLRQAMLDAQYSADAKIVFELSGTPPFRIDVDAALPPMYRSVSIDATTQPGYTGTPLITIANHTALPAIELRGGRSVVAGLRFVLAQGDGVVSRADGDIIGLSVFEREGVPSLLEQAAVRLQGSGGFVSRNTIGYGTCVLVQGGSRNSIAANTLQGCNLFAIALTGGDHTSINSGNVIGGTIVAGNPSIIVDREATNTYIGESTITGASNGIELFGDANYVQDNLIRGVTGYAIRVDGGQANFLTRNTIYNTGSDIEMANNGNARVLPPTVDDVIVNPAFTQVAVQLRFPDSGYRSFQLFQSDTCDARAPRVFVGSGSTGSTQVSNFTIAPIKPGAYVTAIATDAHGNSSGFSHCVQATGSLSLPAPVITSIDPPHGISGTVHLHGANFAGNTMVYFGGLPARRDFVTADEIDVQTPDERTAGADVEVVLRNPDGQEAKTSFHYDEPCYIYLNRAPRAVAAHGDDAATFTVVASSISTPVSYQWYAGSFADRSHPLAGQTSPSLTTTPSAGYTYWVEMTNPCGQKGGVSANFVRPPRRTAPH